MHAADLIRSISDPEHPLTLEQLAVVSAAQITVTHGTRPHVLVEFTPTIPHCSMATLIGKLVKVAAEPNELRDAGSSWRLTWLSAGVQDCH